MGTGSYSGGQDKSDASQSNAGGSSRSGNTSSRNDRADDRDRSLGGRSSSSSSSGSRNDRADDRDRSLSGGTGNSGNRGNSSGGGRNDRADDRDRSLGGGMDRGGGSGPSSSGGGFNDRAADRDRSLGASRGLGDISNAQRSDAMSGVRGGMVSDENANRSTNASYDRAKSLAETGATARDMQMASMARASENLSMDVYSKARKEREVNSLRAGMAQDFRAAENQSMADLESFKSNVRDALLDAIAGPESANQYDVMYGGTRFSSFEDHPRVGHTITSGPNKGKVSTAAGRHQMLAGTWDQQKNKLGLTDFSPKNQDIAAFDLAKTDYARKTGRNLETDLASAVATGDMAKVGNISRELSGTWTSLPGGIEQTVSERQFAQSFDRAYGRRTGGTQVAGGLPDNAPTPSSRPAENRFASTYMGKPGRLSQEYANPNETAEVAYFGSQPTGQTAAERQEAIRAQEERLASAQQPSTTRAPTNIGTITRPASVTREDAVAEIYGNTPGAGQFPDRPRTTGQKVAAAGIDLGLGMLPGIGMGIGLVNGGLALTGNRTLGERIVDAAGTGENGKLTPNTDKGGEYEVADNKTESTVQQPKETFEDRYIAFVDPTPRPTPAERWNYDTPGFT